MGNQSILFRIAGWYLICIITMDAAAPDGAPPRRINYLTDKPVNAPPCLEVHPNFSNSWFCEPLIPRSGPEAGNPRKE